MHLTRRGWAAVGCGLALVAGAAILATPALLFGAAAVGATLLGSQYAVARGLADECERLQVAVDVDPESPSTGEEVTLTLRCRRERPSLWLRVVLEPSPALLEEALAVDLGRSATGATTVTTTPSVAGTYTPGSPRLVATDRVGLFYATAAVHVEATIRVRPTVPDAPSVDIDGRQAAAFGDHGGGHSGSGIEPLHLRPYGGSAPLARIDWKATARLDDVYVTEPEAETGRQTVLLVDQRVPAWGGDAGSNRVAADANGASLAPLAALCHAALTVVERSRTLGDPVGLYAVGEEGVTEVEHPDTTPDGYRRVVTRVGALRPTDESSPSSATGGVHGRSPTDAGEVMRAASTLAGADDQFAETLGPFFADATPYLHRVEDDPLLSAARTYLARLQGPTWTVVLADDRNRAELRRTVDIARQGDGRVLVVLAPLARFEAGRSGEHTDGQSGEHADGLSHERADGASREHAEAATFRRELNAMSRVDAIVVGPDGELGPPLREGRG